MGGTADMAHDLFREYAQKSDDELLQLATERESLRDEAAAALDAELSRRRLTHSEEEKHERFVKRKEQIERLHRRRKLLGSPRDVDSWVEFFWAMVAMALIAIAYLLLPARLHMRDDWQEAAIFVMFCSVPLAIFSRSSKGKFAIWTSLLISSAIHLVIVHAWMKRAGDLGSSNGRMAVLLGFVLFFAVYGLVHLFERTFYGEQTRDIT